MSAQNLKVAAALASLSNAGANANGVVLSLDSPRSAVAMALTLSYGTVPTTISTQLQGSMDGVNWYNVGTANTANTNNATVLVAPSAGWGLAQYFRAQATIVGGTGVSLSATIGAGQ